MRKIYLLAVLASVIFGCASSSKILIKSTDSVLKSEFYENQFTGFFLYDPTTKDTLYTHNSSKYFTPASNTKILTLYTALKMLPDSIPAFRYLFQGDQTFIQGTGDPTLFHTQFDNTKTLNFLKAQSNITLYLNNFDDDRLGPGWSWGDYQYYYQAERSAMPIFGNVVTLQRTPSTKILPHIFNDSVVPINASKNREPEKNIFYFDTSRKDTLEVPFRTSRKLVKYILEEELKKEMALTDKMPSGRLNTFYGINSDTVFRRMMHKSDNFLAEQLLILASSTLSDTLNSQKARKHILDNYLKELKQTPRWVDGSGLSRYNLITPEGLVHVLDKLYTEISRERLLSFFPAGGVSGTLKKWYPGDPEPYIYAKTGSLSNNHCLSGYLITKSGKTLIFSFMNNHFRDSSSEVKRRMQQILENVRDTY
ncbi:D-alanyl-D-alanine carboxypeptidase/D-alanyl-D-alanine-endopeptidase (penicillin-binding protein 4) [Flavobacteriaceae bacterium MAR_2009_75]|nr:D-alanyl-D-alanine carboxypeptidase/D-alanyl-D-alanine-endopeptidase (penicillin-binding protein 4) [Flavobacteriaceae bacterium MAR_2009_75]